MQGSQAYAKALSKCGILTAAEADTIVKGLSEVAAEWKAGTFVIKQVQPQAAACVTLSIMASRKAGTKQVAKKSAAAHAQCVR